MPTGEEDRSRFKDPLVTVMKASQVFRGENPKTTDSEYLEGLERRGSRVCRTSKVLRLHRAVMTVEELKSWIATRNDVSTLANIHAMVLEVVVY